MVSKAGKNSEGDCKNIGLGERVCIKAYAGA